MSICAISLTNLIMKMQQLKACYFFVINKNTRLQSKKNASQSLSKLGAFINDVMHLGIRGLIQIEWDLNSEYLNNELLLFRLFRCPVTVCYSSHDLNSKLKNCYSSHQSRNL